MGERPIRIILGKPGLDGHDRGVKVVARMLRDAGMEVIYTGLFQSPQQIVQAALEEDVDVIGCSILSGAHMTLLPKVIALLHEQNVYDIPVVAGGIIPREDADALKEAGVAAIFGPDTPSDVIVQTVRDLASRVASKT